MSTETKDQKKVNKPFWYHTKQPIHGKRFTIAGIHNIEDGSIQIGISKCHKNDLHSFDKEKGRQISLGRAMKRPMATLEEVGEHPGREFREWCKAWEEGGCKSTMLNDLHRIRTT